MRLLICAVFATILAMPQTMVERTFVIRAETTTVDPYSGMEHVCLLVYPDGKYRMEHSEQGTQGGAPDTRVYLDQLPDASMQELQAALDGADFQAITTPEAQGGIIQNMDMLSVTVPRDHGFQNLSFQTADQRKPYSAALKPLMNWMKEVQKRKVRPSKGEPSDNCRPPQVTYRMSLRPAPQTDDGDGQP